MNPGIGEEGVKAVGGAIDALKTQPAVLALIIANLALLGFLYFAMAGAASNRDTLIKQVIANSTAIQDLLKTCATLAPTRP